MFETVIMDYDVHDNGFSDDNAILAVCSPSDLYDHAVSMSVPIVMFL